jgi:hypothetical protein
LITVCPGALALQTRKAVDRLRKLSSLKFFASKTHAKVTGAQVEVTPAKKKELRELFSLIDEDGSGEVSTAAQCAAAPAGHGTQ